MEKKSTKTKIVNWYSNFFGGFSSAKHQVTIESKQYNNAVEQQDPCYQRGSHPVKKNQAPFPELRRVLELLELCPP